MKREYISTTFRLVTQSHHYLESIHSLTLIARRLRDLQVYRTPHYLTPNNNRYQAVKAL